MKFLKKTLLFVLFFFLFLTIAYSLLWFFFPGDQLLRYAETQVEKNTPFSLKAERVHLNWKGDIVFEGIQFSLQKEKLKAVEIKSVHVWPDWAALFRGEIRAGTIEGENAEVSVAEVEKLYREYQKQKKPEKEEKEIQFPVKNLGLKNILVKAEKNRLGIPEGEHLIQFFISPGKNGKISLQDVYGEQEISVDLNFNDVNLSSGISENLKSLKNGNLHFSQWRMSSWTKVPGVQKIHRVHGTLNLEKENEAILVAAKQLELTYDTRGIYLSQAKINLDYPDLKYSGSLAGSSGGIQFSIPSLSGTKDRLQSANVNIQAPLARLLSLDGMEVSGDMKGNFVITGKKIQSGKIYLYQPKIVLKGKPLFSSGDLVLENSGGIFTLSETQVLLSGHNARISGRLQSSPGLHFSARISGDNFSFADLLQTISDFPASSGGGKSSLTTDVAFRFQKAQFYKISASQLSGTFISKSDRVEVNNFTMKLADGTVSGNYSLTKGKAQSHRFSGSFSGLKSSDLLSMFSLKTSVDTRLSGSIESSFAGSGVESMKDSLSASIKVNTLRGRLSSSFLQRGMLNGPLAPLEREVNSLEFQSASGDFIIKDKNIRINHLNFKSPVLELSLLGYASFQGSGEGHLQVKFSRDFIAGIANPVQLGIQEQLLGNQYLLRFSCSGSMSDAGCWKKDW